MLSSSESASPEHSSRSGSRRSTIGNSWQHGAEIVASSGGKKTEGAHKRPSRALLSNLQPVFPCGLMPVKHEMHSVSPPEFTTITHNNPLVERFLRWPMVVLLMIGGKCSLFASKLAHISGHLPSATRTRRAWRCWREATNSSNQWC
jgi:hypothetical protein